MFARAVVFTVACSPSAEAAAGCQNLLQNFGFARDTASGMQFVTGHAFGAS